MSKKIGPNMSHRSSWAIFRLLLLFSMYMSHFIEVFSYLANPLPEASECLKSCLGQNRKFKKKIEENHLFHHINGKMRKMEIPPKWGGYYSSCPQIFWRPCLPIYLMVLLAVLLVDKSMYDIGLIHPKSSAAQKNPLLIAQQCSSALLSSSNNRVS